ncbi:P-loop containing nucleoside triphosphate hydrolase protein [Mariannaea sp. PMI_226]|nr:P-loop containing nucleoside triphosphate hydrolase protein [Mariannaea sp. PMI_226]
MMEQRHQQSIPCSIDVQNVWGPQVHGCGTNFDLTLLFQETVLSIGPLCMTISLAVWRMWQLVEQEYLVSSPVLYIFKICGYVLSLLLQIAIIVIQVALRVGLTQATIAASCLGIFGIAILMVTSHYEHNRSVRGSTLLLLYLSYSILADAMRARTLWSMPDNNTLVAAVLAACCVCKLALLIIEHQHKAVRPGIRQPTPDERADILSQAFLWWLVPLFGLSKKTPKLTLETLPDIEPELTGPGKQGKGQEEDFDSRRTLKGPSVFHHLFAVRGWLLMSPILPRLAYTGFMYAQPFLVQRATDYMSEPSALNTNKVGGSLIAAYLIVYTGIAVTQALYRQCTAHVITAVRADLVTLIHSHTLKLGSSSSAKDATSTLMSAHVERFATGSRNMHECWACIVEAALGVWLLEQQLNVAVAATGGLTAVFVALTIAVLPPAGKRQNQWLKGMETRIAATTQSLQAIKGIKMTGIAPAVHKDLTKLRKYEAQKLRRFRYILLVIAWAAWIPVIMAPILGFTQYSVIVGPRTGRTLTPAMVYRCLTIFTIFGNAVAALIDGAINLGLAVASLLTIQSFLLSDNARLDTRTLLPADSLTNEDEIPILAASGEPFNQSIRLKKLNQTCGGWNSDAPLIVHDATLDSASPTVLAVVGAIGCGKTTLLQMILGETQCTAGSIELSSLRIGYCSQTPWLTNDSIRNNIVGSEAFDQRWYNQVIHATALDHDLKFMALSDNTVVGNEGSSLSGGQKKRIALARAIYTRAPIVILDDPFNGLDGRTENAVLESVLGRQGLLRKRDTLVVWATSTVQQVRVADRIVSLTDTGNVQMRDSLLMPVDQLADFQGRKEFANADVDINTRETAPSTLQIVRDTATGTTQSTSSIPNDHHAAPSNTAVYRYYIRLSGRRRFLIFLILCAIFVFGMTFNQYWIVRWAASSVVDPNYLRDFYIGLYFAIGAVQLLAWTAAAFFFIIFITEKSADSCYILLLNTVLRAPMSFHNSTPAGEVINRFSQDLQLIDTELPLDLLGTVTQFMIVIGMCGIIIYGSPWSGLAIPIVGVAMYLIQRTYLLTSRQLRTLEIAAKAPLFSHFLETINGLTTIRALQWTSAYARKNLEAVRVSQKPFYLLFSAQNWLNLVLDLTVAGLAVTIMCVGVATRSAANSTLGLSLFSTSSVGLSAKQFMSHWTQLETSMAAVERVRAFTEETATEEPSKSVSIMESGSTAWHGSGSITFCNVSARYTSSFPLVLRDISFNIQPGQRYAICGRTGSGKSTLLAALLRLVNLDSGIILVDDTDIYSMAADQVRSRFITLPQEPVLVSGSVRHNMQLYEPDSADEDMIAVLDDFGLWQTIISKGGLDVTLSAELLSHGQRQLFCLARSTLQKGNIVILDEPSSQFDEDTELKMESTIRERFKNHTVLCIAHKLSNILDFDNVLVMDAGLVAESGKPRTLLQDDSSLFSELMRNQWHQK